MYYDFFGLHYPPFKITPDTQLFYSGGSRGLVLEALCYAIVQGEGIVKVVGEVGSGKTMLCRMLEEKLPPQVDIIYLANPRLSPDMILHAIAFEMQLSVNVQTNRLEVMHHLYHKLLEKHAANKQMVVFIEEAQGMPLETLEEIRLLSNLETTKDKLLQIVLFGQPELDNNLAAPHIRQLKERITHNFYLSELKRQDIADYLYFRMQAVGYRGPPVFLPTAIDLLARISQGILRRVNILADKALLAAFSDNSHFVKPKHIRLAAKDSGFKCPLFSKSFYWVMSFILIIWLALGYFFYWHALPTTVPVVFNSPFSQSVQSAPQIEKPISERPALAKVNVLVSELLSQRLQATQAWLQQTPANHYTIQVLQRQGDKVEELERLLKKPEIQPLLDNLYIYRVQKANKNLWGMVYQQFTDTQAAQMALQSLPDILLNNRPFVLSIKQLQDKLKLDR